MAKVLSSISLDSPSSPFSGSTNDTFSFAGTPTLSGGGGVQRYDFKWEVDAGGGYVTIGAGTGLTTSGTNPLVNTNSQTQNSITVTCSEAGSYTIRMSGAPTSGGSYTVFSSTQTVEVSAAAQTFQQSLSVSATGAVTLGKVSSFVRSIAATSLGVVVIGRSSTFLKSLSATSLGSAVLTRASVIGQALDAVATGVGTLSEKIVMSVSMTASAVGAGSVQALLVIVQGLSATASAVADLATQFIQGSGGRVMKFTRGFMAGMGRMMGR